MEPTPRHHNPKRPRPRKRPGSLGSGGAPARSPEAQSELQRENAAWLRDLTQPDGSPRRLAELEGYVRRSLGRMLRSHENVGPEDLEEFTQETLTRVLERLHTFRGDSRFTTWATAVAARVAFTALRRRRPRALDDEQLDRLMEAPAEREPEVQAEQNDLFRALRGAIARNLTERQRAAILAELEGLPTIVIAERLSTSQNALYKLHHDARRKLRAALEVAGFSSVDLQRELGGVRP